MIKDFNREVYQPLLKNKEELDRINRYENSMVSQYSDPDAQMILMNRGKNMNKQQQAIFNANPNVQRDVQKLSSLDQITNRLIQQKQMLDNDYLQLYGQALLESNKPQQSVAKQTDTLLRGSALGQMRDQGFAMGQATRRGDSQAMKSKIQSDINTQGQQQRSQIMAQQDEKMLQAENIKTQILMNIASQLQQQQQQNFQNQITRQQLAIQKSSLGGRNRELTQKEKQALLNQKAKELLYANVGSVGEKGLRKGGENTGK